MTDTSLRIYIYVYIQYMFIDHVEMLLCIFITLLEFCLPYMDDSKLIFLYTLLGYRNFRTQT